MKKLIPLLFLFIFFTELTYSQIVSSNNVSNHYLDSALTYFKKARSVRPVDNESFEKGRKMLNLIWPDYKAVKLLQWEASEFTQREYGILIRSNLLKPIFSKLGLDSALEYMEVNLVETAKIKDSLMNALKLLILARLPSDIKSNYKSLDFYSRKLKHYLIQKDSEAVAICYWKLSDIAGLNGLDEYSIYLAKKSLDYVNPKNTMNPVISRTWPINGMDLYLNQLAIIGDGYIDLGDYPKAIKYLERVRKIAFKRQSNFWDSSLIAFTTTYISYSKLMMGDTTEILPLLNQSLAMSKYTREYDNQIISFHVRGIYYLTINKIDSSINAFETCLNLMNEHSIKNRTSMGMVIPKYYLAKIMFKQKRFNESAILLEEEISVLGTNRNTILKELKFLTQVYLKLNQNSNAEKTFNKILDIQELIRKDELENQSLNFESEKKITEAENAWTLLSKEKEQTQQTRNYLIGIAIILLLLAAGAYNKFIISRRQQKIIENEKRISDNLLLNILPAEVAEELKTKGYTSAKHYDDVTVIFTDFVNFTSAGEKMSPQALIDELHTCFKAFDEITQKFNIEKIKTIGDAYLAVCGLPTADPGHAGNILHAAIKIKQFMDERQKKIGKNTFEIRIGINSGNVVAGIVGVKKFAYDIWGDTVNTAARLQQNSENGKINISGSTYELVKDKFKCSYRGKIEAKGKGEIDMYYVDNENN